MPLRGAKTVTRTDAMRPTATVGRDSERAGPAGPALQNNVFKSNALQSDERERVCLGEKAIICVNLIWNPQNLKVSS